MTIIDTALAPERSEADNFGDLTQRVARVAVVAAADADSVDCEARFPHAAIAAAKAGKLLGVLVPREFGGEDASIFDVTEMSYALGRACASSLSRAAPLTPLRPTRSCWRWRRPTTRWNAPRAGTHLACVAPAAPVLR